jgi:arabinan endo-1,5-alpha-L-arabinosidase
VAAGGAVAGGSAGSAGRAGNAGKAGNGGAGGTPPADAAGGAGGATRDATSDEGGVFPDASPDVGSPRDASAESAGSDVRDASAEGASDAPSGGFSDARSTTHLDIPAHDPAIIWDGARYSLFATGGNLGIRNSGNLLQWKDAGSVFSAVPAWVTTALGADPGGLWAPDISNFSGKYRVYYAGSTFGSNRSVIGLATNVTLDRASASYAWVDEGLVFESVSSNNYNAIDPNVSFDESGTPWLSFGSFWDGIKMRKLDASTGKLAASDTTLYSLASRGGGAIEAPSIIARGGYYYLFVSFDACCKGASSTYRTMVGRATSITGPYVDKAGAQMMKGAAEELLKTSGRYIGPGGGTAYRDGALYFYVYHYYDGQDGGNAKLAIRPISFSTDGWPTLDEPLFP